MTIEKSRMSRIIVKMIQKTYSQKLSIERAWDIKSKFHVRDVKA